MDHAAAFRTAVALVRHVRRHDSGAVGAMLADAAPDPEQAAVLIMGLAGVVISLLDALPADVADRLLDETLLELASAQDGS